MKKINLITMTLCLSLLMIVACKKKNDDVKVFKSGVFLTATDEKGLLELKTIGSLLRKENLKMSTTILNNTDSLKSNLFGEEVILIVTSKRNENGGKFWTGYVNKKDGSYFFISEYKGFYNIDIIYDGKEFQLKDIGNSIMELREFDNSISSHKDGPVIPNLNGVNSRANPCSGEVTDGMVDIAVYYTPRAKDDAGGVGRIELEAYHSVSVTNQTFLNSGVQGNLNLVYIGELNIDENKPSMREVLYLVNNSNNPNEFVHPTVLADKAVYHFDIGVVLINRAIVDTSGMAIVRHGFPPFNDPLYDGHFATYGSMVVAAREYAGPTFTFQHEIGHVCGVLHDCNNTIIPPLFPYSHGFSDGGIRTIMGYDNFGEDQIPYWSNPNKVVQGVTIGTNGSSSCEANATFSLNNYINRVANYQCSNSSFADVVIKDAWTDNGNIPTVGIMIPDVPSTSALPNKLFNSSDVWVRTQNDGSSNQHAHQDPILGNSNHIYVKLRNGGTASITGTLEVYYANANTNFNWGGGNNTGDFILAGPTQLVTIGQNITEIVGVPWDNFPNPINGSHYCLYARWVSSSDPMQTTETTEVWRNTAYNNNIAWKNLNIISINGMGQANPSVYDRVNFYLTSSNNTMQFLSIDSSGIDDDFFINNHMNLRFDSLTTEALKKSEDNDKLKYNSNGTFSLYSNKVDLVMPKTSSKIKRYVDIEFQSNTSSIPTKQYFINMVHFEDKKLSGGFVFQTE